jgi:hypothetical protein
LASIPFFLKKNTKIRQLLPLIWGVRCHQSIYWQALYYYNPSKFLSVEVGLKIISIGQFAMYLKVAFIIS